MLHELFHGRLLDVPSVPGLHAPASDYDLTPDIRAGLPPDRKLRPAAVLVPVIDRDGGATVLLTLRTDHLSSHPGQVAFPGGRVDDTDRDPVDTALRETWEEIGLDRSFIDIVGALDTYETGTGFSITPVVGLVRPGFSLTLQVDEVAQVFEVPLDFFLDPANHQRESREWRGAMRHYYVMPYDGHHIWGATAGILVNLYNKLKG
ncbi:CoA pyrophosphatase [Emcibacter sp. SYSU 3D8]|uniref:CoA pyrophosphatase n=1 Tax=Emcibacter sp. SYSU 3D8 TaxID=3133969 RepID=UPI0031FF02E9